MPEDGPYWKLARTLAGLRNSFKTECAVELRQFINIFESDTETNRFRAIWRGYREIKEAAGWVALAFSGMGIYRFCKYRVDFSHEAILRLNGLRSRFEVAADTLHPRWRQLLSLVGEPTSPRFTGHPHDWVIADDEEPLPLPKTYTQWDPDFSYEHIEECVLDKRLWSDSDPRRITVASTYCCSRCGEVQSDVPEQNYCKCFPNLYGTQRGPCPVQIYRTADGRNNGLIACLVS